MDGDSFLCVVLQQAKKNKLIKNSKSVEILFFRCILKFLNRNNKIKKGTLTFRRLAEGNTVQDFKITLKAFSFKLFNTTPSGMDMVTICIGSDFIPNEVEGRKRSQRRHDAAARTKKNHLL